LNRKLLGALLVSSSLVGCSAGGGGRTLSPLPGSPATSPSTAPASGGSSTARGRAMLRLTIPRQSNSSARHRDFISPSTQGVAIQVTHMTGSTIDYNVTINYDVAPGETTDCTGGDPQVCTLPIPAPLAPSPDYDTFNFTLYDQAPTGTPLTFGTFAHVLGTATIQASIAPNVNNSILAYVGGIPASASFVPPVISGDGYLGFSSIFGAQALDMDQNVILGGVYDPYNPGFTLGVTEQQLPAGSTTLSIALSDLSSYSPAPPVCNAAATAVTSVTTCRSSDILSFAYLQPAASPFDMAYYATVAATTLVGPALYVSPIYISDTTDTASRISGGPSFAQGSSGTSPSIALDGGTGTVNLLEPGPAAENVPVSFTAAQNANCSGVIASGGITAVSATEFTIAGATGSSAMARRRALHLRSLQSLQSQRPSGKRRTEGDPSACVVTFTDNFGGNVALVASDLGESSQFLAIPGETIYAGQDVQNNDTFIEYDLVNVQPGSPYFGDPYFVYNGDTFGPGFEGSQVAHTAPDQNGNYSIVVADDFVRRLFTFPVTAPTATNPAYTVGSNIAAWPGPNGPVSGGVAVDSQGNAYASAGSAVDMFSLPQLTMISSLSLNTPPGGSTPNATGIALDSSGRLFVADNANDVVDVYSNNLQGTFALQNQLVTGAGSDPKGLAVDPYGDLFVVLANDQSGGSGQSQVVVFTPGATAPSAAANVTPTGLGVTADGKGQVFVETAGRSPTNGGVAGGGIYQYTFTAPATLTSVGQLMYQGVPVNATGGYLNF